MGIPGRWPLFTSLLRVKIQEAKSGVMVDSSRFTIHDSTYAVVRYQPSLAPSSRIFYCTFTNLGIMEADESANFPQQAVTELSFLTQPSSPLSYQYFTSVLIQYLLNAIVL